MAVFSARTLGKFEDASASIPLRRLVAAFEAAGVRPGRDPGGGDGARRTQFRRYVAGTDPDVPQQLERLCAALGALIAEVAASKVDFLVNAAASDGFAFADGVFRPAASGPIGGIDVSMYLVKDMDRAVAFYRDTLGLDVTQSFGETYVECAFADGTTFGLFKQETWSEGNGVAFNVSDIGAAVKLYRSRGVKFQNGGRTFETPVCFIAVARDSEGNTFMLHQRKKP